MSVLLIFQKVDAINYAHDRGVNGRAGGVTGQEAERKALACVWVAGAGGKA